MGPLRLVHGSMGERYCLRNRDTVEPQGKTLTVRCLHGRWMQSPEKHCTTARKGKSTPGGVGFVIQPWE